MSELDKQIAYMRGIVQYPDTEADDIKTVYDDFAKRVENAVQLYETQKLDASECKSLLHTTLEAMRHFSAARMP